jgi:hypothetical protein
LLPVGDNEDPEVVFETQLITAYPDPRRNPPMPPKRLAKKEPRAFK